MKLTISFSDYPLNCIVINFNEGMDIVDEINHAFYLIRDEIDSMEQWSVYLEEKFAESEHQSVLS